MAETVLDVPYSLDCGQQQKRTRNPWGHKMCSPDRSTHFRGIHKELRGTETSYQPIFQPDFLSKRTSKATVCRRNCQGNHLFLSKSEQPEVEMINRLCFARLTLLFCVAWDHATIGCTPHHLPFHHSWYKIERICPRSGTN